MGEYLVFQIAARQAYLACLKQNRLYVSMLGRFVGGGGCDISIALLSASKTLPS